MRKHHLFSCSCHAAVPTLALSLCFLSLCAQAALGCRQVQHASECVGGETFLNSSRCCEPCLRCDNGRMFIARKCNVTHNTECDCEPPQSYVSSKHKCVINCKLCPVTKECVPGMRRCLCENDCYADHDEFCTGGPLNCINEETEKVTTQDTIQRDDNDFFPEWGIGLVAIGVVIGIIIFASCFLCLGLVTITKHRESEPQTSESSESGLVVRSSFGSVGTESSLLSNGYPYLTSHCMLELLKQNSNNPQLLAHASSSNLGSITGGGPTVSSSLRSSPVSIRDSPRPVRTIRLVKQHNKLSAVVL